MRYKDIILKLKNHDKNNKTILRSELFEMYKQIYNNDNLKTFENLISYLKANHVIVNYSKDKFYISDKIIYRLELNENTKMINEMISSRFPELKHLTWETNSINEFTHHYSMNNCIIVEVEKFAINHVFYYLKENLDDYLILTEDIFNRSRDYIFNNEKVIIIKNLHSKSPLNKTYNGYSLSIEKMMVDLFKDKIYLQFQGKELEHIFENIFDKYDVDINKLFKYAKVRGNFDELKQFLDDMNLLDFK